MSRLILTQGAAPSAPASNKKILFVDNTAPGKALRTIDDTGKITSLEGLGNFSVTSQAPVAATRTYIAGTAMAVPSGKLQVGSQFWWKWNMTKTANGSAASTIEIAVGTTGTVADAARVSFTKPAGTAVIDEGWCEVYAIVRTIGSSGVMVGTFTMIHNLAATGHMVIPACVVTTVGAGFDMTVANLILGITITTGSSDGITIQQASVLAAGL